MFKPKLQPAKLYWLLVGVPTDSYIQVSNFLDAIPCLGWSSTSRDIKLVLQTVASYHGTQVPESRVVDYQKYPRDKMYIFHKFADPTFSPLAFEELHSLELTYGCGLETFVYEVTLPIPPTISSGPYSPTAPVLSLSADALRRVHVNQLKEKPVSLRRVAAFGLRPSNNTVLPIHNKQYEQTEDNVIVTNRQGYGLELDDDKEEGELRSERSRPMQEQKRGMVGHEEEMAEEMEMDTEEHLQSSYQELLEEDEEASFDALYNKTAAKDTDDNLDISDHNQVTSVESIAKAKILTLSTSSTQPADNHIDKANQPFYNSIDKSVAAKRRRTSGAPNSQSMSAFDSDKRVQQANDSKSGVLLIAPPPKKAKKQSSGRGNGKGNRRSKNAQKIQKDEEVQEMGDETGDDNNDSQAGQMDGEEELQDDTEADVENDYNPVADPAGSDEPLSVTRARLQKAREEAWKRNAMSLSNSPNSSRSRSPSPSASFTSKKVPTKRISTGKATITCDLCDKSMLLSSFSVHAAQKHMKLRYKCKADKCQAAFARQDIIIKHDNKLHNGEAEYEDIWEEADFEKFEHIKKQYHF